MADTPKDDAGTHIRAVRSGSSFCNPEEASVVLRLMLLLGEDPTINSIMLLTPYASQVRRHAALR